MTLITEGGTAGANVQLSFGWVNEDLADFCWSWVSENGASTTQTASLADTQAVHVVNVLLTTRWDGDFDSWDASGATFEVIEDSNVDCHSIALFFGVDTNTVTISATRSAATASFSVEANAIVRSRIVSDAPVRAGASVVVEAYAPSLGASAGTGAALVQAEASGFPVGAALGRPAATVDGAMAAHALALALCRAIGSVEAEAAAASIGAAYGLAGASGRGEAGASILASAAGRAAATADLDLIARILSAALARAETQIQGAQTETEIAFVLSLLQAMVRRLGLAESIATPLSVDAARSVAFNVEATREIVTTLTTAKPSTEIEV